MISSSTIKKAILALLLPATGMAQVSEIVTINPGYMNQTFYSMSNATVLSVDNTDWDLAFQISGFEAAILINSKNNVKLYKAGKDASEWNSIVPSDTTGMYYSELLNNDAHIFNGAFNTTADTSNMFDLGWGEYDLGSHSVIGDSLYFIRLSNNDVKKIWIESLANAVYQFRYANLDGSNEQIRQFQKLNFPGKNFGYYSIVNDVFLDREPLKNTWDLCFQQYVDHLINYKVTGILTNDSVQSLKAYPVNDPATATDAGYNYAYENNIIGYNWKTFNGASFVIEDSTVYFVIDRNAHKWKMVFTGFGGSANGNFYFDKYDLGPLSVQTISDVDALGLYPNPTSGDANLLIYTEQIVPVNIHVVDLNGKIVYSYTDQSSGLRKIELPTSSLSKGIYVVQIISSTTNKQLKLSVN
jgi:hypothetical protein